MATVKFDNSAQMKDTLATKNPSAACCGHSGKPSGNLWGFVLVTIALMLCFSLPLYHLLFFAAKSRYFSYILFVPFVSLYLVWLKKGKLPPASRPLVRLAIWPVAGGLLALVGYWLAVRSGVELALQDRLGLMIGAFLLIFLGVCCFFLGKETLRAVRFPLGFLFFMVPFPSFVMHWIEYFLQHWSAAAAYWMFSLSGVPFVREGLLFDLPGITLEVAPECSGTQSTLALFLTSLLAGHLFLRTPWKRAVLTLVVIPLAILRNGFRIFTIGQLCVHISPDMINSRIHHQGGPLFFALSLVPFFLLLLVLAKSDRLPGQTNPEHRGV